MDELKGQLLATQLAIRSLIMTQADPQATAAAVHANLERWLAHGHGTAVNDALLDGFEKAISRLLPSARDAEPPAPR